jgi:hypothetical protein
MTYVGIGDQFPNTSVCRKGISIYPIRRLRLLAVAVHLQDLGAMRMSVEHRASEAFGAKHWQAADCCERSLNEQHSQVGAEIDIRQVLLQRMKDADLQYS